MELDWTSSLGGWSLVGSRSSRGSIGQSENPHPQKLHQLTPARSISQQPLLLPLLLALRHPPPPRYHPNDGLPTHDPPLRRLPNPHALRPPLHPLEPPLPTLQRRLARRRHGHPFSPRPPPPPRRTNHRFRPRRHPRPRPAQKLPPKHPQQLALFHHRRRQLFSSSPLEHPQRHLLLLLSSSIIHPAYDHGGNSGTTDARAPQAQEVEQRHWEQHHDFRRECAEQLGRVVACA